MRALTEDGQVTRRLAGKTIHHLEKNGRELIIVCTDGHQVRIGWQTPEGDPMAGEPYVAGIDVKVILPRPIELLAAAEGFR